MEAPEESIQISKAIFDLQWRLLGRPRCSERQLVAAGALLSLPDYDDVVTERSIARLCGSPLCPNPLPPAPPRRGRYRVALREHRVYDLHDTARYCSAACHVASKAFAGTLPPARRPGPAASRVAEILRLLAADDPEIAPPRDAAEQTRMIVRENRPGAGGAGMTMEQWAGPPDAIEGFVPRSKSTQGTKSKLEVDSAGDARPTDPARSCPQFTSEIIFGDVLSEVREKVESCSVSSPLENVDSRRAAGKRNSFPVRPCREGGETARGERVAELKSSLKKPGTKTVKGNVKWAAGEEEESCSMWSPTDNVILSHAAKQSKLLTVRSCGDEGGMARGEQVAETKSSLKKPGKKMPKDNVKWSAEEQAKGSEIGDLKNNHLEDVSHPTSELDCERSLRVASAEACANALIEASEAVASGKCEVEDAVNEAGIVILPSAEEEDSDTDTEEEVNAYESSYESCQRWLKKPLISYTHDLISNEHINLTLSTFMTMWNALFEWITCSSVTYVYGKIGDSVDEFLLTNGIQYPPKVVLSDGRSSEIKTTLSGYISRALPQVVSNLMLPIPISTMENSVGILLDTMTFIEAVPSFKTREWHVMVLLFLEAISVFQIPTLAAHLDNKKILMQQVIEAAHIRREEYEVMRDQMMPLGRSPQFSAQSGA